MASSGSTGPLRLLVTSVIRAFKKYRAVLFILLPNLKLSDRREKRHPKIATCYAPLSTH